MDVTPVFSRIKHKRDTTAHWNEHRDFVPLDGEPIIYVDYKNIGTEEEPKYVPGLKIGDGVVPVVDLPFVDDALAQQLIEHINDRDLHIQPGERQFWNNKLNVLDGAEVQNGVLVFNRN